MIAVLRHGSILGRAQEASGRRTEALTSYEKARSLDPQYAAAHLQVGTILALQSRTDGALKAFQEAIRLYSLAAQHEGEVETLLRMSQMFIAAGKRDDARAAIDRALPMITVDDAFHRVRARFDLARLTAEGGNFSGAAAISRATMDEAINASLFSNAASGLVDLANALSFRQRFADARTELLRAIQLATTHKAKRAEMRARLQHASLLLSMHQPQQAIDAARDPLVYFESHHFPGSQARGKLILAAAHEELDNFEEAVRLTAEVLTLAETNKDDALKATALENLASVMQSQGRLPEALDYQVRLEALHREQKINAYLAYDLTNRAEFLIRLGRGQEALEPLEEIAREAAKGIDAFKDRRRRSAMLRAMHACIHQRWKDVDSLVLEVFRMEPPDAKPDDNFRWGQLLREYARANVKRSGEPVESMVGWLGDIADAAERREAAVLADPDTPGSRGPQQSARNRGEGARREGRCAEP